MNQTLQPSRVPGKEKRPGARVALLYVFGTISLTLLLLGGWQFDRKLMDSASKQPTFSAEGLGPFDFNGNELWIGSPGDTQEYSAAGALFLYVDDSVDAPTLLGDYDRSGTVDQADYTLWKSSYGQSVSSGSGADGNSDGVVNLADYTIWRNNLGATLPATFVAAEQPVQSALPVSASDSAR